MELHFKRNCTDGLSPNTVLPPQQHFLYTGRSSSKRRPTLRDDLLSLKKDFIDISFTRYRSASCKSIPSKPIVDEGYKQVRRGSVYQSSNEVRKIKKMGSSEGRRKIEISGGCDASFSSEIFDSLCGSDEDRFCKRSPTSLGSNPIPPSVNKTFREPNSSDGFIEISLDVGTRGINAIETVGEGSVVDVRMRSDIVVGPVKNGNELLEKDAEHTFHKSLSAKLEMPRSPSTSESECSSKTRFTPIRKMFDPFMKSKSLRSPSSYVVEPGEVKTVQLDKTRMSKTYRKSLMHDFSVRAQELSYEPHHIKKDENQSRVSSSPVHLRGYLKLESKNGIPYFEFSVKCPEDVFVAKTWKANDAFNWVYTFHSIDSGKKSNARRCGLYDRDKDSSMVGQMQVSCCLCSELKDGVFENSMVTEFVLYDISHARSSVASQESSNFTPDAAKPSIGSNSGVVGQTLQFDNKSYINEVKPNEKHVSTDSEMISSKPYYPWPSANLHPDLEIAAIVMQLPFEKRESLKNRRGDNSNVKAHKNLLNFSVAEQSRENLHDSRSVEKVKVIIPSGNHGLPSVDSQGPSSLLDRWRLGGGCDCGGWDMSCPLIILGNPHLHCADNRPIVENQQPLEIFVQGKKEKTPALIMTVVEEGLYAVDFHAQLSTLQAFSICVAVLHGTETSSSCAGEDKSKQLSPCNALKVLIGEEVKFLIETVTSEEKRNVMKRVKEISPSYALKPPFSPIARV